MTDGMPFSTGPKATTVNSFQGRPQYTWGLDLSGQSGQMSVAGMHGAGGIGGLLACREMLNPPALVGDLDADHDVDQTDYSLLEACWTGANVPLANTACGYADLNGDSMVDLADLAVMQPNLLAGAKAATERDNWYFYDGNGNVGQLLHANNAYGIRTAAFYEYDPYGNTIVAASMNSYAVVGFNPFRFSTKWLENDLTRFTGTGLNAMGATGLYYYGYRYYSPNLGRWINRDPMEEEGGTNLYLQSGNNVIDFVDPDGLKWTIERNNRERAIVRSEPGDTINDLSGKLRLDPSEFEQWLKPEDGLPMPRDSATPMAGCRKLSVPNTVMIVIGDVADYALGNVYLPL